MDDIEYLMQIERLQNDYSRLADELAKMREIQAKTMAELDCGENVRKLSKEVAKLRIAARSALANLDALSVGVGWNGDDDALLETARTTLKTALAPNP